MKETFFLRPTTEAQEQEILARWLDFKRLRWCHVANEGKRDVRLGQKLKRLGMKAGVPDILIFSPPPATHWPFKGVAIELKIDERAHMTDSQMEWLTALRDCGWRAERCNGSTEAIKFLKGLGY